MAKFCPNRKCRQTEILTIEFFCPECGEKLTESGDTEIWSRTCSNPECGKILNMEDKFCTLCGAKAA